MIGYHFSFTASLQELTLKRGQTVEIKVNISTTNASSLPPPLDLNIKTVASGTSTPTDDPGNSTGFFSDIVLTH